MFGYPGVSGAPLFDTSGHVVGLMRGTRLHNGEAVAAYAYADRLHDILRFLRESGVAAKLAARLGEVRSAGET
jgi:hypothetical protein